MSLTSQVETTCCKTSATKYCRWQCANCQPRHATWTMLLQQLFTVQWCNNTVASHTFHWQLFNVLKSANDTFQKANSQISKRNQLVIY